MDVTLWGAFVGGLLSFVSPCVLPLVPPYLCYLAGVSIDEFAASERPWEARRRIILSSATFVLGFSVVFVALGASASALGQAVRRLDTGMVIFGQPVSLFSVIAGIVIIIMGLHFLGVFRIGFLDREARFQVKRSPTSFLGAFIFGIAFALGWTPCIGPVLGTVLLVAQEQETVGQGAVLLFSYSLGMGVPFLAAAVFAGSFMRLMVRFRRYMGTIEKVMGGLLVVVGVLFVFGQMTIFSYWLLDTFPGFATIG